MQFEFYLLSLSFHQSSALNRVLSPRKITLKRATPRNYKQEMETNWQTTRQTIKERNKYMYNNTMYSDVEFSVINSEGDTITVPAHKYVLAISSPVFEAMFYGKMAETNRTINLPDCTAEGLLELFRYMYYDEVELTGSTVMEVLYLAKKYFVPSLADKCTQYLKEDLGPEDVFSVLPEAVKLGEEKLQELCWKRVDLEPCRAVTSEPFLHVTQAMLCDVLERDTLEISEVELFQAVLRWAEHNIQEQGLSNDGETKRHVLGDKAIHLIRFPLVSMDQIVEDILPLDILTKDEIIELFAYFSSAGKPSLRTFNADQRRKYDSCRRFQSIQRTPGWGYTRRTEDTIKFTTSSQVYLSGVRICGVLGSFYNVKLRVYKGELLLLDQMCPECETEQVMTDSYMYDGVTLNLDRPVCVDPGIEHTIEALIDGPESYRGIDGMEDVQCKNTVFHFAEYGSPNGTSQRIGQLPELLFYQLLP